MVRNIKKLTKVAKNMAFGRKAICTKQITVFLKTCSHQCTEYVIPAVQI